MRALIEYVRDNTARAYALVVAVLALVAHYLPDLPGDLILGVVAAALMLLGGEVVQRVENRKTVEADVAGYAEGYSEGLHEDPDALELDVEPIYGD